LSESILEEAQRLIHGERNKNYGHPRENFRDIAALFSGYLGKEINEIDVANLMILVKVARVKDAGYHRDSFTDIAGYAGCVERIYEEPDDSGEKGVSLSITTTLGSAHRDRVWVDKHGWVHRYIGEGRWAATKPNGFGGPYHYPEPVEHTSAPFIEVLKGDA